MLMLLLIMMVNLVVAFEFHLMMMLCNSDTRQQ
jgi:hypothetical protein